MTTQIAENQNQITELHPVKLFTLLDVAYWDVELPEPVKMVRGKKNMQRLNEAARYGEATPGQHQNADGQVGADRGYQEAGAVGVITTATIMEALKSAGTYHAVHKQFAGQPAKVEIAMGDPREGAEGVIPVKKLEELLRSMDEEKEVYVVACHMNPFYINHDPDRKIYRANIVIRPASWDGDEGESRLQFGIDPETGYLQMSVREKEAE